MLSVKVSLCIFLCNIVIVLYFYSYQIDRQSKIQTPVPNSGTQEEKSHCFVDDSGLHSALPITPPYRVYIYDLPATFNTDIVEWHDNITCYDTSESGYGDIVYNKDGMMFRNTWHGLLEITMHHRLLRSSYRTMNPDEADMFYIPYYHQMLDKTSNHRHEFNSIYLDYLHGNITKLPYLHKGVPHFTTIGNPETFMSPYKRPDWVVNILYITLERAHSLRSRNYATKWFYNTVIAPYQAIGHFTKKDGGAFMTELLQKKRDIFIFLAAGGRGKKSERYKVIKQINVTTTQSYGEYIKNMASFNDVVMFQTRQTCKASQSLKIIEWMQNAVFCLQPAGDTATRKSFFDSVITGCIPVIFEIPGIKHVMYPFESMLDYSKFTIYIRQGQTIYEVLDPYRKDIEKLRDLQQNLARIAKYLQYYDIYTLDVDYDAFQMILDEVGNQFGFFYGQEK